MFRPCIDLHEGKVKQIVGGTLDERGAQLRTNFVSQHSASWFAELYKRDGLRGGHVIMLGPGNEAAARAKDEIMRKGIDALFTVDLGRSVAAGDALTSRW